MKKTLFASVTFILCMQFLFAQKEGNVWYFGQNAGVDFNGSFPVAINNGMLVTQEGCSSISDGTGSLLFYTDGLTVYNRLHNIMPNGNGLNGNASTSQSAIIVQQPGSTNLYYIFTMSATGAGPGLNYSKVDMTLAGGNGDIINKNTPVLGSSLCEKITATQHANGTDVWVSVHELNNNAYYAYLVTAAGLSAPVITNVGSVHNSWQGYMQFSPEGSKLAATMYSQHQMDILDFNNATGVFSNPITFVAPNGYDSYGVEFSCSGNVLYLVNVDVAPGDIYQFNLQAGSPAAILASATIVHSFNDIGGALQLGPDGKIYYTRYQVSWIGVINAPDSLGTACNAVDNGINIGPGVGRLGLPNNITNIYQCSFNVNNVCFGDTSFFDLPNVTGLLGVTWDFGDPGSGANNFSSIYNPFHIFSAPGTFTVQLVKYYLTYNDTLTLSVIIHPVPSVNLGPDTVFCTGSTVLLNAGGGYSSYLWQDGSTDSVFVVSSTGTYSVFINESACSATDTITLTEISCQPMLALLASSDTLFCEKQCIDFFDMTTNNPTSWQWTFFGASPDTSTQQNPTNICYNSYGSFNVQLIACNSIECDTVLMTNFINEFQNPVDSIYGSNDTLWSLPFPSYQWYEVSSGLIAGATNQYYVPTQLGSYFCVVDDSIGCIATSNTIVITGINQSAISNSQFAIIPNPNDGNFEINFGEQQIKNYELRIFDAVGKIAFSDRIKKVKYKLSLSLEDGIYFLQLKSSDTILNRKLIIKH